MDQEAEVVRETKTRPKESTQANRDQQIPTKSHDECAIWTKKPRLAEKQRQAYKHCWTEGQEGLRFESEVPDRHTQIFRKSEADSQITKRNNYTF